MDIWVIILIAVIVSAILRIAPIYLSKLSFINNNKVLTLLDYAACAAIGCMIYFSAFSKINLLLFIINILVLLFTFLLSLYLRKPVKTFIICILLYAISLYLIVFLNI
jgi:hypothetical protein